MTSKLHRASRSPSGSGGPLDEEGAPVDAPSAGWGANGRPKSPKAGARPRSKSPSASHPHGKSPKQPMPVPVAPVAVAGEHVRPVASAYSPGPRRLTACAGDPHTPRHMAQRSRSHGRPSSPSSRTDREREALLSTQRKLATEEHGWRKSLRTGKEEGALPQGAAYRSGATASNRSRSVGDRPLSGAPALRTRAPIVPLVDEERADRQAYLDYFAPKSPGAHRPALP